MKAPQRAFAAIVGVTLAGQLGAIAYEVAVAGRFGTGLAADSLALSLTLILAVSNEIVTWISTLFIPQYIEARTNEGPAAAASFFRGALWLLVAGSGGVAVVLILGAPWLVALLAPDLAARAGAPGLLRLFGPLLLLLPLAALLAGVLQAHERFVVASARQLCWYGLAVASVIGLGGRLGAAAVPVGMTLGLALFCALLWGQIRRHLDGPRGGDEAKPRLWRTGRALPPLALASAANYLNVTVERGIAGHLPPGSLAALTYAFRLLNFPVNLFLLNATTVLFPALASYAARGDTPALEALLSRALRLALVFTVPLAGLSIALAEPAVRVLLERGAFTEESTRLTASALAWYAPGLLGMAGVSVMMKAYQALQEIRRMVWTGIAVVGLNLALMPILTLVFGFPGLPAAISAGWIVLLVVMLLAIRRRLPGLDLQALSASAWRAGAAGAASLGLAWLGRQAGGGVALAEIVAGGAVGIAAYIVVLAFLSRADARLALEFVAPFLARRP